MDAEFWWPLVAAGAGALVAGLALLLDGWIRGRLGPRHPVSQGTAKEPSLFVSPLKWLARHSGSFFAAGGVALVFAALWRPQMVLFEPKFFHHVWPVLVALNVALLTLSIGAGALARWGPGTGSEQTYWSLLRQAMVWVALGVALVALAALVLLVVLELLFRNASPVRERPIKREEARCCCCVAQTVAAPGPPRVGWTLGGSVAIAGGVGLWVWSRRRRAGGDRWEPVLKGAAVGLVSLGGVALAKELTVFKDFSLVRSLGVNADSLLTVETGSESAPTTYAMRSGALDLTCKPEWTVATFGSGLARHLEKDLPPRQPAASEPNEPGEKLRDEVAKVTERVLTDETAGDGPLMLVGSTDTKPFVERTRTNGGLAFERARTVAGLIRESPAWRAMAEVDRPSLLVLNGAFRDGVARPVMGIGERDAGRSVMICRLSRDRSVVLAMPGRSKPKPLPVSAFGLSALAGFVLGALLVGAITAAALVWRSQRRAPAPAGARPWLRTGPARPPRPLPPTPRP